MSTADDRGQVTTLSDRADEEVATVTGQGDTDLGGAITTSIFDVAGLDSERVTQSGGQDIGGTITDNQKPIVPQIPGVIRIRITIPRQ